MRTSIFTTLFRRTPLPPWRPPIAIMSFDRPDYLRQVLASLRAQTQTLDDRHVHLFQDGAVNASGERFAKDEAVKECIELFRAFFPRGKVWRSRRNIGIALNFKRAEERLFANARNTHVYFFEDDLVLHPSYLDLLDHMAALTATYEPAVGYFTVHGNFRIEDSEQIRRRRELDLMGHNWAFGLRRSHWLNMQPLLAEYYRSLGTAPYRRLPARQIIARMRALGVPLNVASQDDAKKAITYALGAVALGTVQVAARYIGERGLNMEPALYKALGYAEARWIEPLTSAFELPNPEQLQRLLEIDQKAREVRWRELQEEFDDSDYMEGTKAWLVRSGKVVSGQDPPTR
jgi:hypothetical protein